MDLKNKDDITSISLQWLFKQASPNSWNLNNSELANLLGINEGSIRGIEGDLALGLPVALSAESNIRLPMLLSIYKGIHEISPDGQETAFFTNTNSGDFLNGLSIKEFLIEEATTDAMAKVIVWLKSLL
jgi:hypothetical protein